MRYALLVRLMPRLGEACRSIVSGSSVAVLGALAEGFNGCLAVTVKAIRSLPIKLGRLGGQVTTFLVDILLLWQWPSRTFLLKVLGHARPVCNQVEYSLYFMLPNPGEHLVLVLLDMDLL